jgi:integrase
VAADAISQEHTAHLGGRSIKTISEFSLVRLKMNDLVAVQKIAGWEKPKALVLDSAPSPITKRVYKMALDEFLRWFQQGPRAGITKATVSAWRETLEERKLGSSSIILRMSAIGKPAAEAAGNGLLAPELAAGIARVKNAKMTGVRSGNWLSPRQAQALLSAPDATTVRGLSDRAILAVLLGCGLRRSKVAALTFTHVQQRDGRWCIVDLVGKHGRVRTAPMPTWVKIAIDAWTAAADIADGHVFRLGQSRRGCGSCGFGREGRLVAHQAVRRDRGRPWNCTARFASHLREVVSGRQRRTGADPVAAGPRIGRDDRAVSWRQAGSGSRSERRDQTKGRI